MSRYNLLEISSDISTNQGRGLLHETLERLSAAMQVVRDGLTLVQQQDRIVRPVPVEAYPFSSGLPNTGFLPAGIVAPYGSTSAPTDWVPADGTAYSTTTYPQLFSRIGYNFGGSGASFNVPDLRGRSPIGHGIGSGLTSRTIGVAYGGETHTLAVAELPNTSFPVTDPQHAHAGAAHTHEVSAHVHAGAQHNHLLPTTTTGAGATTIHILNQVTGQAGINYTNPTTLTSPGNTSLPSPGAGGSTTPGTGGGSGTGISVSSGGSGTALPILDPKLCFMWIIKVAGDPTSTIQEAPVSWGPVAGKWTAPASDTFPSASVANNLDTDDGKTSGICTLTAAGGAVSGNTSNEHQVSGIVRVPYNFRAWRTRGVTIRTKVSLTGVATSSTCILTLKVEDPVNPGTYKTKARTVSESAGSITDSDYVEIKLTAEELGPDWRPGYPVNFILDLAHPKTFTALDIRVGLLEVNWR